MAKTAAELKSEWALRALDLAVPIDHLLLTPLDPRDVADENRRIGAEIKRIREALPDPDQLPADSSARQKQRLQGPVQRCKALLQDEQTGDAELQRLAAEQVLAEIKEELQRKRSIIKSRDALKPAEGISERQAKRLSDQGALLQAALDEDAFDSAQTELQTLEKLHATIDQEVAARAKIQRALDAAKNPDKADEGELQALAKHRDAATLALAEDRFVDAGGHLKALTQEAERITKAMAQQLADAEKLAKELSRARQQAIKDIAAYLPGWAKNPLPQEDALAAIKATAANAAIAAAAPALTWLVSKQGAEPSRSVLAELLLEAESLRGSIDSAKQEAQAELLAMQQQIENQREMVEALRERIDESFAKLGDPMPFADALMSSWPKDVPRKNLGAQLLDLIDLDPRYTQQSTAESKREEVINSAPWTRADWLGVAFPLFQKLEADLQADIRTLRAKVQEKVLAAMQAAMTTKVQDEKSSRDRIAAAIQGKEQRTQLADALTPDERRLYDQIDVLKGPPKKLNIVDQVKALDALYAQRGTDLAAQGQKLELAATSSGVPKAEVKPEMYKGLKYTLIGSHGGKPVYARLDDCPTGTGMGKFIGLFKTAMGKGVIPASSTGSEGVKIESHLGGWVVKVTRRAVDHNPGFDNTVSPLAESGTPSVVQLDDPPAIYLNFTAWTDRH